MQLIILLPLKKYFVPLRVRHVDSLYTKSKRLLLQKPHSHVRQTATNPDICTPPLLSSTERQDGIDSRPNPAHRSPLEHQPLQHNQEHQVYRPPDGAAAVVPVLHCRRLLAVQHVHEHAGRVAARRGARVVAAVRRQRPGDEQPAGAGLLLGHDADAAALGVVDDIGAAVPVDEAGGVRRLEDDARQVDVAAALDVELRVADDFSLGNCKIGTVQREKKM